MGLCGGSSGGSGQRDATAEEKRLWAAQADATEALTQASVPNLQTGMNNLGVMANESMDGTLAGRLRATAGTDAESAISSNLAAVRRGLDRYGATLNPNALAAQSNDVALRGAAAKSMAMNGASAAAEDMKWNRNSALTSLATGQGSQAISSMGALSSQIGQNRRAAMADESQELQGLGMMGAYAASRFARGGKVKARQRAVGRGIHLRKRAPVRNGEVHLADGGGLQKFQPTQVKIRPWSISGGSGRNGPGTMAQMAAIAEPFVVMKGIDMAGKSFKGAMAQAPAPVADAAITPVVDSAIASSGTEAATTTAVDALASAAADKAVEEGAKQVAAMALDAAVPGAGQVLQAIPLKDGGAARGRKDMTPGGKVSGPGTETSDSIPARLSVNEFVTNADGVKLDVVKTRGIVDRWKRDGGSTEDLLEDINDAGLKERGDSGGRIRVSGGEARAAMGGIFSGLGQAARGFVPVAMQLDQREKDNERADQALEMQRQSHVQGQAIRGIELQRLERQQKDDADFRSQLDDIRGGAQRLASGDQGEVEAILGRYNSQKGPFNDGMTATYEPDGKGGATIVRTDKAGKSEIIPLSSPELLNTYVQGRMMDLAFTSPERFQSWVASNTAAREKQLDRDNNKLIHEGNNKATMYAADQGFKAAQANNGVKWAEVNISKKKYDRESKRQDMADQALADMDAAERSGDQMSYNSAKRRAMMAGIKFDRPQAEVTTTANPMGGYLQQNKVTGRGAIWSQDGKKIADIPPMGGAPAGQNSGWSMRPISDAPAPPAQANPPQPSPVVNAPPPKLDMTEAKRTRLLNIEKRLSEGANAKYDPDKPAWKYFSERVAPGERKYLEAEATRLREELSAGMTVAR